MSKKKHQNNNQAQMSDERFIKERMRNLEIGMCYCTEEDLRNTGEGVVIVSRKHTGGRVSFCCYLVDTYCLGVKDVHWMLRAEDYDLKEIANHYNNIDLCDYVTAHNWIYGAEAFAEDAGISPCKEFRTAQYFLQEDDDEVPLIEFPFGKDGKHFLVANDKAELNRYLPVLHKNLGEDFLFSVKSGLDDNLIDEEASEREDLFEVDRRMDKRNSVYSYQHPEYPKELNLQHPQVYKLLNQEHKYNSLPEKDAKTILSLPKEELRIDLEHIVYFILGRLYADTADDSEYLALGNALMLLGEVGNPESSLEAVMEVMRVPYILYDLIIGDWGDVVLAPVIYKLGSNRLDRLKTFMLEEGLENISKSYVSRAVYEVAMRDKKRREEVIDWYRDLLTLVVDGQNHDNQLDPSLIGLMLVDLVNLEAKELLPEIKSAFEHDVVNYAICDKYPSVYHDIMTGHTNYSCLELDYFRRIDGIKKQLMRNEKIE